MITSENILVEKLNRLIDENLELPSFGIDTICQTLGISRSKLHRTVKDQTDLPISLYIRKRRLQKARYLLLNTDLRIAEIGDNVGINNPQNFSTYFIGEFKVSPSEFRKLYAQLPPVISSPFPDLVAERLPPPAPSLVSLPSPDNPVTGSTNRLHRFSWRKWGFAGLTVGMMLGMGAYLDAQYPLRAGAHPQAPAGNSLAVLPFTNLGTAEGSPVCDEIMDDVHASVSLLKNLKVIARSSSDQYQTTRKSIRRIGDELQVAIILKGSVLKTNNQIQIKVELIRTADDSQVWVHRYGGAVGAIFQLTDQIVRDVAMQLKLPIPAATSEKLTLARTRNLEAYNLFLKGRQLLISRTKANVLASVTQFNRALALDSTFAEAYALKAEAYIILPGLGYDTKKTYALGEQSALKAIHFEPTNSTAYAVLGTLYHDTYEWQAAENAFRIALQYNPNDAQADYWYSLLLRSMGRLDEAIRYSTQAVQLDPLYPVILSGHILNCAYANRFDLTQASINNGQAIFGNSFVYYTAQGYAAMCQQKYGRAVANFRKGLVLNPDYKRPTPVLIYCEAKLGNRAQVGAFLRDLTATTPRAKYERAVVYAGLNERDSCLAYLKKAADEGYMSRPEIGLCLVLK